MENYNQDFNQFTIEDFAAHELFQKWVFEADSEARVFWENWLNQHPEKSQTIADARKLVLSLGFHTQAVAEDRVKRVKSAIDAQIKAHTKTESIQKLEPQKSRLSIYRNYYWAAASIIGLLIISFWWYQSTFTPSELVYKTNYGETKNISLPDGSEVSLNANSTLIYRQTAESRIVNLDGDALFKVKEILVNPKKKIYKSFIVKTNRLNVKVLGTEFNVKSRHRQTEVVLHSGKVQLSWQNAQQETQYIMKPGEQATYHLGQKQPQLTRLNADKLEAWHQHKLVFDEATLQEVADEVKANFGIEIIFKETDLARKKFVGSIPNNDLKMLFQALSRLYGIEVKQQGKQVILSKVEEAVEDLNN